MLRTPREVIVCVLHECHMHQITSLLLKGTGCGGISDATTCVTTSPPVNYSRDPMQWKKATLRVHSEAVPLYWDEG